jgi:hypothetical protein
MPCFKPLEGFRSSSGKGISFNPKHGYVDMPMSVPCGKCIGCRLERSREWAVRIQHEASQHPLKCFVTLTYDETHIPEGNTLVPKHLQDFLKRLRKRHPGHKIRFFACGEYGETTLRPHYHAILFGIDFPDKTLYRKARGNNAALYKSGSLDSIWGHGFCSIGSVSFDSAAYVARYTVKKINGDMAESHYQGRIPEFGRMSRRPGIGSKWIEKFTADTYPSDTVISKGFEAKPPRFYDKFLQGTQPALLETVKRKRLLESLEPAQRANATPDRLNVREICTTAKLNLKKRTI